MGVSCLDSEPFLGDASGPLEVWFVSWLHVGQPLAQVEVTDRVADRKNEKMHRFMVCL